ncbi:hypothetical protein [Bernardetia sp.]|uniref:hypothetical protein n=1 Tax=Bernardetia sp. TaxID=1937974 RepID=UPI0025BE51D1|nr:hypothetical protein [Bernardetia sp.]
MGNINQELERLQLISNYIKGKLSAKQLEKFKKRLENDPVLKEELYKHKKLIELLKKKQEQDITSLLDPKNDVDYMKKERIYRRNQLRQELEKIKEEKTEKQKDWERKITQSHQPSIYKVAAVFLFAITIGASVFVVATHLIDTQNEKALQAEVTAPTLVEVEINPADVLEKNDNSPLFENKEKEVLVKSSNTDKKQDIENNASVVEKENLIAYQPIPNLEDKLAQNTRSTINLISPVTFLENYDKNISFEWRGTSEEEIYLELINSKEEVKTYYSLESPFVLDENLEQGIYYWILQTESEVIKRGKFLVK